MSEWIGTAVFVAIGALLVVGLAMRTWEMFFGKCPYCQSRDFVPDDAMSFYCNGCRRKF